MFQRIDFHGGYFELVSLPMARHQRCLEYRNLLREALGNNFYWIPEMDGSLYQEFAPYYRKIAELTEPAFDPDHLLPLSRHRFFICTDLLPHPENTEELIVGLPQIDTLLGLSYPPPESKSGQAIAKAPSIELSSGDPIRDLLADLLIVFGADTQWLMQTYSAEYLHKLAEQAIKQKNPELKKQLQKEADEKFFQEQRAQDALRLHYIKQGIPIPDDF